MTSGLTLFVIAAARTAFVWTPLPKTKEWGAFVQTPPLKTKFLGEAGWGYFHIAPVSYPPDAL